VFNILAAALVAALPAITVRAPHADLTLEVAATPAQRQHGLMYRTAMSPHTGMIFVFDRDDAIAFWMKNTLVPLDMIFVGADGTVRRVFANVPVLKGNPPDDQIPLEAARAKYVIELRAGEAASDGIAAGVILDLHRVPAPS
jgi:hypothetical protein